MAAALIGATGRQAHRNPLPGAHESSLGESFALFARARWPMRLGEEYNLIGRACPRPEARREYSGE